MNLLTLGDSFTYGEELNDRSSAWPQQLANQIGAQLINLGVPSNSNPAMCRQLIEHFSHKHNDVPDIVVIGWSSPGRTEHSDNAGNFSIWPGYSGNLFKQHHPWREDLLRYVNQYHNDKYLYETFLQHIVFVQSFLESRNIKCVMMNTVGNEYYKNIFVDQYKYADHLINIDNFVGWPNEGMAEWVGDSPRAQFGHFLEEGHKLVANKVYEHIRHLGWVS